MRFLLSALVAIATFGIVNAKAPYTDSQYEYAFTKWIKHHNKVYAHDEFFSRFHIFKSNLDKIYHHNNGNHSYTLSMNQFGDMTQDELKHTYNGFHGLKHHSLNHKPHHLKHVQVAQSIDWRAKAAVTPVKNQGQCGACWSFSTTGAIEGAHAIATGTLISLSEQQLVDCNDCWRNNTPYCNSACNGGLMDKAFQWIIANGGITGEADQPYIATTHPNCTLSTPIRARITGYSDIPIGDEATLLRAVNIGPVSIGIEADQTVFQFYSGGVLDSVSCGTSLDHGVLIVGYGTDTTLGKDYWIVKNSWGAAWGEAGYVRLVRNKNQCGLANAASYPTGVH